MPPTDHADPGVESATDRPEHDDGHRHHHGQEHRVEPEREPGEHAVGDEQPARRLGPVEDDGGSEERERDDEHARGVGGVGGDREHHQRARGDPAQRGRDQPGALVDQSTPDEEQRDRGADPRHRAEQLERYHVGAVEQVGERRVEVGLDRKRVDGAAEHDGELSTQDLERLDAGVGLVGVDHRCGRVEQQPPDHDPGEEQRRAPTIMVVVANRRV